MSETIKPTAALVVYSNYLEVHEIIDGKFGPGKPCTEKTIRDLQKVLIKQKKNTYTHLKGLVPSNLIYLDSNTSKPILVWRTEKHKQQLLFSKNTEIASGEAEVPNMIWKWDGSLEIYAYKEWKEMDTKLFYVPLPNTNQGGVCLGNVKIKESFENINDAMEAAMGYYWNSTFTHKMDDFWINYWNHAIAFKKTFSFIDTNLQKEEKYKTLKNFINEITRRN